MNSIFGVVIAFTVISIIFFLLGHCFCALFQKEEETVFQILLGAVVFLAVFSVIELPIEKLNLPFHVLVYVECFVFAALLGTCAVWCVRKGELRNLKKWTRPDTVTIVLLVLITLQVVYGMNNGIRINGYDSSYYNGHAVNALYTDTMYQYSARSGEYIGMEQYVHDGYPMLIAFLSKVFFMHPLVMVNRVLSCMEIVLMNMVVYEIAYRLSAGSKKIANWTVAIHAAVSILCYAFEEGRGFYLWQRTAESKSMLANVYLPLALWAMILLAQEAEQLYSWIILGLVAFVGASLSISGIFILTAMIGSGLLAILICRRKWKYLLNAVLCMIPCMIVGITRLFL